MSHFYGTLQGTRGKATRCGTKKSGLTTYCASWKGAIRCHAYTDEKGEDCVIVEKTTWQGQGEYKLLYEGPIGKKELEVIGDAENEVLKKMKSEANAK